MSSRGTGIVSTNHRIEWVRSELYPELSLTDLRAIRLDSFAQIAFSHRYPHKTVPNAIRVPRDVLRFFCCEDKPTVKKIRALMLEEVGGYSSEEHIAIPYRVKDEFKERYRNAVSNYKPTISEPVLINVPKKQTPHPFNSQVPVDLFSMDSQWQEFQKWIGYVKGETKTKPKALRREVDPIRVQERRRYWKGNFVEGSDDWHNCPIETSPGTRTADRLTVYKAYLDTMIDIAQNNGGSIPMTYGKHECGRFFAIGYPNLQSCPKLLTKIALSGQYEYDIRSCNQTIHLDYAQRNGLAHEAIAQLVFNKDPALEMIARDTKIDQANIKTILLALSNLAELKEPEIVIKVLWKLGHKLGGVVPIQKLPFDIAKVIWEECRCAHYNEFANKYTALYENDFVRQYLLEERAVAHHAQDNVPGFGSKSKPTLASAMSFFNMEIEANALQAMYRSMPSAKVANHDAVFCSDREDIERAEAEMLHATGINFWLKESLIMPS